MSNLLEQASLVMIPSGYKEDIVYSVIPTSGAGDLTFTRASNGTRIDSNGNVELVPWNLAGYSENFTTSGGWNGDPVTATLNYGIAPNGTQTSTRLQFNTANEVWQKGVSGQNGNRVVLSFWIKGTAGQTIQIYDGYVDKLITIGSEWTRIYSDGNIANSGNININTYGGNARTFEVWGLQVNYGSTAKPYFPTTDRLNVPRLTYQNGGGGCPSLLLEKQSTNFAFPSEDFSSGNYIKAECSVTANSAISPDGTQNADSYISTTSNAPHPLIYVYTSSGTITYSLFVKKSYSRYVSIKNTGGPVNWGAAIYDLDSIVVTKTDAQSHTIVGASIVDMGNGWRRITITTTGSCSDFSIQYAPNGTANFTSYGDIVATGTNQVDYYIYGAQIEVSSYPTSYIPTTSSSATRVADSCYKTGISSLIGQTEGTLFADVNFFQTGSQYDTPIVLTAIGGAGNGYVVIDRYPNKTIVCEYYNGGSIAKIISSTTYNEGRLKIAFGYKQNDFVAYVNGVQIGTDTSGNTALTLTDLYMPYTPNASSVGINEAILFPTRLTNSELAQLTGNQNYTINQAYESYGVASESPNCVQP